MEAIPTTYNGIEFRSKLEAKYAEHLDGAGIRYVYEVEGYKLPPDTWYLPDFFLPDLNWFLEVKGPHREREEKPFELAKAIISDDWKKPFSTEFEQHRLRLGRAYGPVTDKELKIIRANNHGIQVAIGDSFGYVYRLQYDPHAKEIFEADKLGVSRSYGEEFHGIRGYICPECGALNQYLGGDGLDRGYFDLVQARTPHDWGHACWRCYWCNEDDEYFSPDGWKWEAF